MKKPAINALLSGLIGPLRLSTAEDKKASLQLNKLLTRTHLEGDPLALRPNPFSIEKSDLFQAESLSDTQKKSIQTIEKARKKKEPETQFTVFRRDLPLRDPLLPQSVASWSAGSKVDQTVGPLQGIDGRQFWFDFLPIGTFTALYKQGIASPILLFQPAKKVEGIRTRAVLSSRQIQYNLAKGGIWINARLFSPNAPEGSYTGLTIQSGTLKLSHVAKNTNKKLTLPANATIEVALTLAQQESSASDKTATTYGKAAASMSLNFPSTFSFRISGSTASIMRIGKAGWQLMGQKISLTWSKNEPLSYHPQLQRILIPFQSSVSEIVVQQPESDFNFLRNKAPLELSGWLLPLTQLNLNQPTLPEGTGQLYLRTGPGLVNSWKGLAGNGFQLSQTHFLASPGQLLLADFNVANPHASQVLELWREAEQVVPSHVQLTFPQAGPLLYLSNANGSEILMRFCDADFQVDRPVKVDGSPPSVQSKHSLLILSATSADRLAYLYDDNLIADTGEITNQDPYRPEQMALAMSNALFKVTQPNGCLLFGKVTEDFSKVYEGSLFLSFGLLAYIPTLPDPYAANLGLIRNQFRPDSAGLPGAAAASMQGWLLGKTSWSAATEGDEVEVTFHFSPLAQLFGGISLESTSDSATPAPDTSSPGNFSGTVINATNSFAMQADLENPANRLSAMSFSNSLEQVEPQAMAKFASAATPAASPVRKPLPDYGNRWEKETNRYRRDVFALLDVSTNADLFGISFDLFDRRQFRVDTERDPITGEISYSFFSLQVQGLDVVSNGENVRAFTVPQISWEPVINLSPPAPPPDGPIPGDPAGGFNYYPNDGGPTRIANNSKEKVVLAPLPLTDFLLEKRLKDTAFQAFSFFTLPFGMKAAALLTENYRFNNVDRKGGNLRETKINFDNAMQSGLQLRMDAGTPLREGDSDMFMGTTVQLNNVLDFLGNATGNSTLGGSVTDIFNREFFYDSNYPFELFKQRGVPVTRMDLSGYGASMFSNWLNTKAAVAETSQAKFDVMLGRCSHEIIQVKSILYPWAIKVVRTITLFRVSSGYVYRFDSGWRAESDGKFDFRYYVYETNPAFPGGPPENPEPQLIAVEKMAEFAIHPGLVKGLYNVSNIVETAEVAPFEENVLFAESVDQLGMEVNTPQNFDVKLQPVYFDADVEIEGATAGMQTKTTAEGEKELVPSSRILGFVQLGPKGFPLNNAALRQLVQRQGTIGGAIDCEVELVGSAQKMRFSHFDFNNSFAQNGSDPVFCLAGRGNVLLPKDGSWSMVRHERANGEVSPVPPNFGIPVIRPGKIIKDGESVKIDTPVNAVLTRIAEPLELFRQPINGTVNYGFLQSTDTQKALLLTPSFQNGLKKLLSKTPPLFVDAFRIVNTKGIFPNIGAGDDFSLQTLGEAILMKKNGSIPFDLNALQDLGQDVFELMDVQDTLNNVKEQGLQLLHNPEELFDLPTEFELIDVGEGNFRIYIEYAKKDKNGTIEEPGSLDFDINSVTESWKSKMNNIGLVIDLAGIKRLMTIRGNWDSEKGKEATYPKPDLEFAPELDPLVDLLEILQSLQEGNYGEAVQNGLQLAMSNKAGSWEYKFEASKEIPVIRFPVPDAVYNDPNTPFKLEAGLKIGAYFNAALKVTTNANELLPSAGGVLGFYGRLSVMCVSVSAATIYAIGQAEVDIAADTQLGPSLRMKFGFGAQIVVGLPVAGNVSVLFVVGAEIFIAEGIVEVSAFLLFEGHAEILGGIVSITIRIEAKGTYAKKALPGGDSRTDMQCQVTFGLDISIAFIININFTESWQEQRRIA
ncbi:hypothetical protein SAMN05192553_101712 [Cyclobacterium xiamenense]|uniref:Uncharacterized protein n=1 Tax=Cyclobacterium xiamenense TaxID=1297121 RepID=A0A1H6UGP7_9BACT|nr:hypothetical protein [Cyclobacterium xiamenense]SEI88887.1 hypothetical protein SAMN05192553_101712 [Cyclobacterium xiamenense]